MKNYNQYTIEDFVQDDYFREWVLQNSTDTTQFWLTFCAEHPEQKDAVEVAKSMVLGLKIKEMAPPNGTDIQERIARILALTETEVEIPVIRFYQRPWFRVAASVALLVSAGLLWLNRGEIGLKNGENTVYTEGGKKSEQQITNQENKPSSIILPDGSTVILEKNSQIRYQKDFKGNERTVYLTGEALFDVVKNPNKPFVVYAGNLVTKVLGTSFRIKAVDKEKDVVVNVIRGRVSVYVNKKDKQKDPETDGLILTPNQKVVFTEKNEELKRSLIEKPVVIVSQETLNQMVFDEAPADVIFKALQKTYGVEILFDEESMKQCALTTTLKNETLFEKLTIICKSLGVKYKVVDAQVIIEGNCQ